MYDTKSGSFRLAYVNTFKGVCGGCGGGCGGGSLLVSVTSVGFILKCQEVLQVLEMCNMFRIWHQCTISNFSEILPI